MSKEEIKENLKSMSLGDHLDELRARLILMLLGVVVGLIITLFFGKDLVRFLEIPYYDAMKNVYQKQMESIAEEADDEEADDDTEPQDDLVCIIVSEQNFRTYQSLKPGDRIFANVKLYRDDPNNPVFSELKADEWQIETNSIQGLKTLRGPEGMLVYFKVCLVFGFILVCPWVFWQTWIFISAGLYKHEKNFVHIVAPLSAILFITGSVFFLIVVAPLAMAFFIRFDRLLGAVSEYTLKNYIDFVLQLTLVFGAAFQMPIAIVFAEMMGLVSIDALAKSRKFVILGLLFVAAVATPPDVISQILLAGPLYILYEASIIVCRIMRQRKKQSN
ncbi:MAG: twin-arginine translocase subunit TatC [Planctomycetota bacterium]|jgi:sec-independent protein translocase protein TatC